MGYSSRGGDLVNTFGVMGNGTEGLYYPSVGTPHAFLESIIRDHPSFFVQPLPNNDSTSHKRDPTLRDWCETIAKVMDSLKVKGIASSGWLVIPSPDPFMTADNVMATLAGPAMRFLRAKIDAVRVFSKVSMVIPVPYQECVKLVHSDTMANPQLALHLHDMGPQSSIITAGNISLATHKSPHDAIQRALQGGPSKEFHLSNDSERVTRLRFFIKPELLESSHPLPVHFYKFLNNTFAPNDDDRISINSRNCTYPFVTVTFGAHTVT